jgi:hydroxymethylglutaryl-CoA lyase
MTERVYVQEVGVRDGLQSEPIFVPTEVKVALIDELSETGLAKIEVTAFVSPNAVPAMRDAAEVLARIKRAPGVIYTALVPNARGAVGAVAGKVDEINIFMSASESHNLANVNKTTDASFEAFKEVMQVVANTGITVNGTISTSFGCPFEGDVAPERVLRFVERYLQLGVAGVTVADTTGMANPRQVRELTESIYKRFPDIDLTLHFHNTRGMGLANVLAGLEAGCRRYDGSIGGLGGCPFAPGATGNICTEDLVHMLWAMGYPTGVDLDRLIAVSKRLPAIVAHDVPGQVAKAGKYTELHSLASAKRAAG